MSDKRIEATRAAIGNALLHLLESKRLAEITVADISRQAEIS